MLKPSRKKKIQKQPDPGKRQCQSWHAKKRAKERLGIKLSDDEIKQISTAIRTGEAYDAFEVEYVKDQSHRLKVFKLKYRDLLPVNVVYDKFRKTIVTFLYETDYIEIYHYYDIFQNKISTKHKFGKIWYLKDGELDIPGETLKKLNENRWIVIDGVLKDRIFEYENENLCEVMK